MADRCLESDGGDDDAIDEEEVEVAVGVGCCEHGFLVGAQPVLGLPATRSTYGVSTSGRPLTLDQGVVFNWIDRTVSRYGDVTMVRYPVNSSDYWAGVQYWWDVEFWNESTPAVPWSLRLSMSGFSSRMAAPRMASSL